MNGQWIAAPRRTPLTARDAVANRTGDRFRVTIARAGRAVFFGVLPCVRTFGDMPVGAPLLYLSSLPNVSFALNQGDFAGAHAVASGGDWTVWIERPAP
jgi:S-adenosylmethionine hydrolase